MLNRTVVILLIVFGMNQGFSSVSDRLDNLIATLPPGHIHSIKVIDSKNGKILFARNSHYNLLPASTVKVITAISAYLTLGRDYRYKTSLLSNKPLPWSTIYSGDLVLAFSGDPSLTRDDLSVLLDPLVSQGVKVIKGNIWLDDSIFDGYARAAGVSWEDHNICFAAPASAIIIDTNCFWCWLVASGNEGDLTKIVYDEPQWGLSIDNRIKIRKPHLHEINGCELEVWPSADDQYRLEGCIEPDTESLRLSFSVSNPEQVAVKFIKTFLKQHQIRLEGKIVIGQPLSASKWPVKHHFSAPLPELLEKVLEQSDNLYADSLLKTIGVSVKGNKGSYASGINVLLSVLRAQGIGLKRARLIDGSGLSRYNLLSADDFTSVLQLGWSVLGEQAPWLSSRDNERFWIKTGYMSGVNSMVGYAFPKNRPPIIFSVLLNGLRAEQPATKEDTLAFNRDIRTFHRAFIDILTVIK